MAPVVIHSGSFSTRAGFAGFDEPKEEFRSVVGRPRMSELVVNSKARGGSIKDWYVGPEAIQKRGILHFKYPLFESRITDWDAVEEVWNYAFQQLDVDSEDQPVFLTEPPSNDSASREKTIQLMFERFNVPSFYINNTSTMALFATGRTTGAVLDVGYRATTTIPVMDGYKLQNHLLELNLAGRELDDYLMRLMTETGFSFNGSYERDILIDIKEKISYVALDYEKELSKSVEDTQEQYELPDGNEITLSKERYNCPELLFKPQLIGMESSGIHAQLFNSVNKIDPSERSKIFENIVLVGGSTRFKGFGARIRKELQELASDATFGVCEEKQPQNLSWIGASITASLSTFSEHWITKEQYEEHGPSIVMRQCN